MLGRGDVGEPGAVERRHEEVARAAGAVAGEHAPRPVRAMCCRGETEDQQPRARIAEAWNRLGPVRLVAERSALFAPDPLAMLAQPRAAMAGDDGVANGFHHTRHALPRAIGASALHENAFRNSG